MSLTTPPQAIAPGPGVPIDTPTDTPWAALVLANLSPYLLEVQAGGQVAWLNPWTETIYRSSPTHAPVVVTAQGAGTTPPAGSSSQIQATWYAPGENPEGAWPVSLTANALAAELTGISVVVPPPPGLLSGPVTSIATRTSMTVPITPETRTLIVICASQAGATKPVDRVSVFGFTSLLTFYDGPPYLIRGSAFSQTIVPIMGAIDTAMAVIIDTTDPAGAFEYSTYGDSTEYDESIFYNGSLQAANQSRATAGTTPILTGPARILTLAAEAEGGAAAFLQLGATPLLPTGTNGRGQLALPPETILKVGDVLELVQTGAGTSTAAVGFAYP